MCLTCGCDDPADDHGNDARLTIGHLVNSAAADGLSVKDAAKNLRKAVKRHRKQVEEGSKDGA